MSEHHWYGNLRFIFSLFFTMLVFGTVVHDARSQLVFDFESLQPGDLEGQGGWLPPIGRNEFLIIPTSSSGGYEGGQGIRPNGLQDGLIPTSIGFDAEAIATFQFDKPLRYPIDRQITVSFDVLFDGRQDVWIWLSDSNDPTRNLSPAFGVSTFGSFTYRYGRKRAYMNAYDGHIDVKSGDWLRLVMVLDPAQQTVRFTQSNLTTGELDPRTFESPIFNTSSLNNHGLPSFDPRTWDQLHIGWHNNIKVRIDNISIPSPVPEPPSSLLLLALTTASVVRCAVLKKSMHFHPDRVKVLTFV